MKITSLTGSQILDSRGNPTLRVKIILENGIVDYAEVPSGASKGSMEAFELRDGDPVLYEGMSVLKACHNVATVFDRIRDYDVENLREIDQTMIEFDGTKNKERVGANTMLGISYACLKAGAKLQGIQYYQWVNQLFREYFKREIQISLPCPLFNILNGGKHADNGVDFQEFMFVPLRYHDLETIKNQGYTCTSADAQRRVMMGANVLHELKKIINKSGLSTGLGDEGGYAPAVSGAKDALNLICEAMTNAGYKPYDDASLGIDCASNSFYNAEKQWYEIHSTEGMQTFDADGMISYYRYFLEHYPIIYLEDFLQETDMDGFARMTQSSEGARIMCSADDLVVTNPQLVKQAIDKKAMNAMIVKPNQIGTFYETCEVVNLCVDNHIIYVPSHRSGETNDSIITDIAVGLGATFLKAGAPQRGERAAKYNRLMEIADIVALS